MAVECGVKRSEEDKAAASGIERIRQRFSERQ
jgi:hypothetical protein